MKSNSCIPPASHELANTHESRRDFVQEGPIPRRTSPRTWSINRRDSYPMQRQVSDLSLTVPLWGRTGIIPFEGKNVQVKRNQ